MFFVFNQKLRLLIIFNQTQGQILTKKRDNTTTCYPFSNLNGKPPSLEVKLFIYGLSERSPRAIPHTPERITSTTSAAWQTAAKKLSSCSLVPIICTV